MRIALFGLFGIYRQILKIKSEAKFPFRLKHTTNLPGYDTKILSAVYNYSILI